MSTYRWWNSHSGRLWAAKGKSQFHRLPTTSISLSELLILNPILGPFLFFKLAHNYGCSCPNGESSFLVWVSFTHIIRKNYFAYSLTNLTFPEGPNIKTKVTASWNTALFFSWAWQFQKQIVMTTNNLEAIQPINLQRKQSSQPRRIALLL